MSICPLRAPCQIGYHVCISFIRHQVDWLNFQMTYMYQSDILQMLLWISRFLFLIWILQYLPLTEQTRLMMLCYGILVLLDVYYIKSSTAVTCDLFGLNVVSEYIALLKGDELVCLYIQHCCEIKWWIKWEVISPYKCVISRQKPGKKARLCLKY